MISKMRLLFLFIVVVAFPIKACGKWGTMDETAAVYNSNKPLFQEIYNLVQERPAIQHVSPAYDDPMSEHLEKYAAFDDLDIQTYYRILEIMNQIGLERVRVWRDNAVDSSPFISVEFLVFARGIGGGTEGITIEVWNPAYSMEKRRAPNDICEALPDDGWYVCESK